MPIKISAQMQAKFEKDVNFRKKFKANPEKALGLKHAKVTIHESTPSHIHVGITNTAGPNGGDGPIAKIFEKARRNPKFLKRLVNNPKAVFAKELGQDFPPGVEVTIHPPIEPPEDIPGGEVILVWPPLNDPPGLGKWGGGPLDGIYIDLTDGDTTSDNSPCTQAGNSLCSYSGCAPFD